TWSSVNGLSDPSIPNPFCFVDTSRWYSLRVESEDGGFCNLTIPVFITVEDIPKPEDLSVRSSICPANTGRVKALETVGSTPIIYELNEMQNNTGLFEELPPNIYNLKITSDFGCWWDTSFVIPLNPIQAASFNASPETGFSPLEVLFDNTSTQATEFEWQIDGEPISQSENLSFTFADSGSFEVSLIAYRLSETCADTVTLIIRVEPGISVLMPNVITPNGDGRNDELIAQVKGLKSCRWVIFDRWGSEETSGVSTAPFSTNDDEFEKVVLWQPESDVSAGIYQVVFIAEGLSSIIEQFSFEVTVVR
ncbi:MAG: hypothetical protein WBG42_10560, partial [Cryomorphaceae bacterium]